MTYKFYRQNPDYKNSKTDVLLPDKIDQAVQFDDVTVPLHNDLLSGYAQQSNRNLHLAKEMIRMWWF